MSTLLLPPSHYPDLNLLIQMVKPDLSFAGLYTTPEKTKDIQGITLSPDMFKPTNFFSPYAKEKISTKGTY